jgi:hypothetical protein
MRHPADFVPCVFQRRPLARAVALAAIAIASAPARSADILGLYLGAAVGQAQVSMGAPSISAAEFRENHSAYQFMAGIRPISLIGAEVAYINFGNPRGSLGSFTADAKIDGTAGFGVFYLPIPVPFLDLYAKGGVAKLNSAIRGTAPVIGAFRVETSDTRPAAGVGAQLKFGSLAVRAEYERFDVAGGSPGLLTFGLTKTFL